MVDLYNFLATVLPEDDVWQVVQRLVCQVRWLTPEMQAGLRDGRLSCGQCTV